MTKVIVIAFTPKGQPLSKIFSALDVVKKQTGDDVLLLHGFLPRSVVEEKQLPTDIVDKLDELFPRQANFWKDEPLRELMAQTAKNLNAEVWVIGEIEEGVKIEHELYRQAGLKIYHIDLRNYN